MIDDVMWFHLLSKTMDPCFLTRAAQDEALRSWLCRGCAYPCPGVGPIDVCLQDRVPRDKPLNLVYGTGVGLIHGELLELIGESIVDRDLYIGHVIGGHGKEVCDWKTFHARCPVIVRGSQEAGYRVCEKCGRNVYCATGRSYLYPAPPGEATVFGSHLYGLVVPRDVFARVSTKQWRMLRVERLPVLAEPADGLGVVPFR